MPTFHNVLVAIVILLLAASTSASGEHDHAHRVDVDEVLHRSMEALGGFERFARLRRAVVAVEPVDSAQPGSRMEFELPLRMTITTLGADPRESACFEERRLPSGACVGTGGTRPDVRSLEDRYWRAWWVLLARTAFAGSGEVYYELTPPSDDASYWALRVMPRDVTEYWLEIDPESWLPVALTYEEGGVVVREAYEAYADQGGLLFPTRVRRSTDGEPGERVLRTRMTPSFSDAPLDLPTRLEAVLTTMQARKGIPGMAAIVMQGDRTLLAGAWGLESVALDRPARLDSVFPIASVSKIFAGVTAMRLVEAGLLDLDAPVANRLAFVPRTRSDINLRHLLNHSHGIPEVFPDLPPGASPRAAPAGAIDQLLADALEAPPRFEPGHGWAYSQVGYVLAQRLLETASGLDYEALVAREILEPLGLSSAAYGGSDRVVPGRPSMDYYLDGEVLRYNHLNYPPTHFTAAGLNATAPEIAAFYRALAEGRLLSDASRDLLWQEVVLETGEATWYALGWGSYVSPRSSRWSVGHSGGGSSWTRYYPAEDVLVVVLSNLNGARADRVVHDLADAVFHTPRFASSPGAHSPP